MSQTPLSRTVHQPFDAAVTKLREELAHEGFGVVTHLDLQKIFETKLGTTFRRYEILGACNPTFAHRAVSDHPDVGVMLPCNVAVYELESGDTQIVAVDPITQITSTHHDLSDLATEVRHRLERVLAAI